MKNQSLIGSVLCIILLAGLPAARESVTADGTARAFELLKELDDALVAMRYGRMDLAHAAVFLDHPELRGALSENLLLVKVELSRAGDILQEATPHAGAALGNVFIYGSAGAMARIGN